MNKFDIDMERRQSRRNSVGFEILLSEGQNDILIMQAVNRSGTGLYVLSEGEKKPTLGAKVKVSLNGHYTDGITVSLNMLVTRLDRNGIGLHFLDS